MLLLPYTAFDQWAHRQVMNIPLCEYAQTASVRRRMEHLESVLRVETLLSSEEIDRVVNTMMPSLIPPGTKAAVRGRVFEGILRDVVTGLNLPPDEFSLVFGGSRNVGSRHGITETPDFVIQNAQKTMYGMAQIDLWTGGAQLNRGMKYILHDNHPDTKLLCVICTRMPSTLSPGSKAYRMLRHAVHHDRLCYASGLGRIVRDFFIQ